MPPSRHGPQAAEELSRLRSDFVAAVSHELRTPLSAMLGYAEILQARWAATDEARKLDQINKIVIAANRQHHNACKYSPEGSMVMVSWALEDPMAIVRVYDRGSGIPEQGRELLFTRFGRIPGSLIRAGRVGTGLGLYISRALAEAMGGELDLEAGGPTGSIFRLRIPRAATRSELQEDRPAAEYVPPRPGGSGPTCAL